MFPPSRIGSDGRRAGVVAAALAALLAPAGAGAQPLPGAPEPGVKIQAADPAAGDLFACAMAMDGGTAAVGSVLDDDLGSGSGSLYVFTRDGAEWGQAAKLLAGDGTAGDQLGYSVGIAGGRLAAGAPFKNQVGPLSGAVYVFEGGGGAWQQTAKLVPAGLGARDELGRSVAVSGAVVAAGAPGDDDRGSSAGAIWVFDLAAGTVDKLTAGDGAAGDGLGFSVALDGNVLLAGAPFADDGGLQAGAVYAFERQGSDWVEIGKLTAADGGAGSLFGWSLSLDGGTAAIGARVDDGAGADSGAVYVFARAGVGWSQQAKLLPPGLVAGEELGSSVALDGGVLVAGARFGDADGLPGAGAAYRFEREGGAFVATHRLVSPTPGAGDELGFAVGVSGGSIFAGAYRDDDGGADAGTIWDFEIAVGPGPGPGPGGDQADLAVTKSDGLATVPAGGSVTYTIVVRNLGPDGVVGATVSDAFPAALLGCEWSCVGAGGGSCTAAGAGSIADSVDLPAGARVTYTASCAVSQSATGTLANTASASVPAGVTDPLPGNDSATDVTTVAGGPTGDEADLSITKTGDAEAVAGGELSYTVTAANAGPDAADGATVADAFDPAFQCAWSCTGAGGAVCPSATGSGDLAEVVTPFPAGGSVTYTVSCFPPAGFEGAEIVNTATVTAPAGVTDPDPSDNTSPTVTTTVQRVADLSVDKEPESQTVELGSAVGFTITVGSAGPSTAAGALVEDLFPPQLACAWSCAGAACPAATGEGDLVETAVLPPGSELVYTVDCAVGPGATGTLTNTATVAPPPGVEDPDPENDADSVTVEIVEPLGACDLSITKTDNLVQAVQGEPLVYTLTIANDGPDDAAGVRVLDPVPANLAGASWSCEGQAGSGDLDVTLDLPAGASVVCTVSGTTPPGFCGPLDNVASVQPSSSCIDPDVGDRTATDTTLIFPQPAPGPSTNPCAAKKLVTGPHVSGSTVIYEIYLFNGGPLELIDGPGDELTDPIPSQIDPNSITAVADSGIASVMANLVTWNGEIPPGAVVVVTVTGVVFGQIGETVVNQGQFGDTVSGPVVPTDDPDTSQPLDPTVFTIAGPLEIPTLGAAGLALLTALLAASGLARLRGGRRRHDPGGAP